MLGKILSLDLKPKGIAICNLHPGFLKTSMTEIYKDKYDEFGAIEAKDAAPGIVKVRTHTHTHRVACVRVRRSVFFRLVETTELK